MMPERVIKTLDGKRGSFLLVGGIAYFFIGLSYVTTTTPGRSAAFTWLPEIVTPNGLGVLWVVGGAIVVLLALVSDRWHQVEKWAFGLMVLCPTSWVVIFTGATITGVHPTAWVSAVAYAAMSGWSLVAAGWDNPVRPTTGAMREVSTHG